MDIRLSAQYDYNQIYATGRASQSKANAEDAVSKAASEQTKQNTAAVYEKSEGTDTKAATYSINRMSKADRASLVAQLKNDQAKKQEQLTDIVSSIMSGQGNALSKADNMWSFLAKGNFTVTPEVKAQAQEDISENGYWGVKQTSQRIFDFASALAGDDEDKMREMETAMEKGFNQAMGDWGRQLPQISLDTMDASRNLFNEYYASKSKEVDVSVSI